MGTYLGLFNGTICIPQIVAATLGGSILALFTPKGMLPPEINMLVMAGVMLNKFSMKEPNRRSLFRKKNAIVKQWLKIRRGKYPNAMK